MIHKVAAVVCQLLPNGTVMFLLVRSRGGSRWTFPKGGIDSSDASPATAAAREALEEAGVTGEIDPVPLGTYRRLRPARKFSEGEVEQVQAWLLRFLTIRSAGEPGRRPTWLDYHHAVLAFRGNPDDPIFTDQLIALLDAAAARLRRSAAPRPSLP